MRLDEYLFVQGQCESVRHAAALVLAGRVYIGETKAESAGEKIAQGTVVSVRQDNKYVSRGGLKLEKAIDVFGIALADKVCMDIGASTGGFTDCMLQKGAEKVYSVDVAYGQLAWSLRCDKRVVSMERFNIRNISRSSIQDDIDFFSVDVSFISLKHIFVVLEKITSKTAEGVCLVKPQFEARREQVGEKGVVRDSAVHAEVLKKVVGFAQEYGFSVKALDFSPITGPRGNIEFLLYVQKCGSIGDEDISVLPVVKLAHQYLSKGEPVA